MRDWNVVFFLRGWPKLRRFRDAHYFVADVIEPIRDQFTHALKSRPDLARFFTDAPSEEVCACGFRVSADERDAALGIAHDYLHGILSGLCLLPDVKPIKSSPICLCHLSTESDAPIVARRSGGWAEMNPKSPADTVDWAARTETYFRGLLTFFDLASGVHPKRDTRLGAQLQKAARLAHAGVRSEHFGLEFIAKFAAMESLVCGGEHRKKGEKLKERVPWLFHGDPQVSADSVGRLWDARSKAVHEANAEFSEQVDGTIAPQIHLDEIDHLLAGVVVFAIAHLDSQDSVASLWQNAMAAPVRHQLPPELLTRRSAAIARYPVSQMVEDLRLRFKNAAHLFETCLNSPPA
jgi:hypothetical protein